MKPWEKYGGVQEQGAKPWEKFAPTQPETIGNAGGAGQAFTYGLNTAVPFGNVISSGIGAGIAKLGGAEGTLEELYNQAQADTEATRQANPWSSGAGTVAGIVSTIPLGVSKAITGQIPTQGVRGAINAIPKGMASVSDFARSGNLALRAVKGGLVAAPVGALYGAGEAKSGERIEGAKRGAGVAAAVGASLPVAGAALGAGVEGTKNIILGAKARNVEDLADTASAIKGVSSKGYDKMRQIGAMFTPEAKSEILDKIGKEIASDSPLNKGLHGSTISLLEDLQKAAESPDFSLEQLDQYRRLFSRIPRTMPEDVRKSSIVIEALDNAVNDLNDKAFSVGGKDAVDALNMARKEYNRFSKFDRIATIIKDTGGDANKLKSALQRFANNPKKTRGFTAEEVKAISDAAKNTTGEGLLKLAGKFGVDLGSSLSVGNAGLSALVGGGSVLAGSGGTGAAIVAGGTAARQAQKWLARGKVEKILQMIEQGGKVTAKELGELPPADAKKLMQIIPTIMTPQTVKAMEGKK